MAERRPPSKARLRRALAAGDSPLSPFSVRVAALAVAALLLPGLARALGARFDGALRDALAHPESVAPTSLAADTATLVAPVLVAAAFAAFAAGFAQTGLAVTFRSRPPLSARFFDSLRLLDVARALVLMTGVAAVAWYALVTALPGIAHHAGQAPALLDDIGHIGGRIAWSALGVAFVLAAADVWFRRMAWLRRLSPSPEEAKRERREEEGAPELRQARRRVHEALARGGAHDETGAHGGAP